MLQTSQFPWEKHPYSRAESHLEKFFAISAAAAAASVLSCSYTYVTAEYCMNAVSDPLSPRPPSQNARNSIGARTFSGILMKDTSASVFAFTLRIQHKGFAIYAAQWRAHSEGR